MVASESTTDRALEVETELRQYLCANMPLSQAPAQLRLAFHDAGPFDVTTRTGGADGSIHLMSELERAENAGWSVPCVELLATAKTRFPQISWADLTAVAGAAAIVLCGGPTITLGLGRIDAVVPGPEHRLPVGDADAASLKGIFAAMGVRPRDLVVLSGAHTLGRNAGGPFTPDPARFTNSYFRQLLQQADDPGVALLPSDRALVMDPDLRPFVERYAADEGAFLRDFAVAYRGLTWLGGRDPEGNIRGEVPRADSSDAAAAVEDRSYLT